MTKALYNENSQTIPVEASVQFLFDKTPLKILFLLKQAPAHVDVACSCCNKSTRQIFAAHETQLPENASGERIMEMALEFVSDEASILDASMVYVITEASVLEIESTISDEEIRNDSLIAVAVEVHANKVLVELPICDGCMYPTNHIENLLKEK
jgi:hypothetical protein